MTTKTSKSAANVDTAQVEAAVQMLLTAESARKRTKIDPVLAAAKARIREMKQTEQRARIEARQQRGKMLGKLHKLEEAARHELEAVRKAQAALDNAKIRRQTAIEERDAFRKSLPKVSRRTAATEKPAATKKVTKKPTKVSAKKVVEKTAPAASPEVIPENVTQAA